MTTTNLGMDLPVVSADADDWGDKLNAALALVDAAFAPVRYRNFTNSTALATTSTTLVMGGYGSSWAATPVRGTKLRITITGFLTTNGSGISTVLDVRYGTGTAPAQGDAVTGSGGLTSDCTVTTSQTTYISAFTLIYEASGLTKNTAYWFDITGRTTSGTSTITPNAIIIEEVF